MKAPLTLEIIIHYYCGGSDTDYMDSPGFREQAKMLVDVELLIRTGNPKRKYEANREAVKVYLDALLAVPFPELEWIIPKITELQES